MPATTLTASEARANLYRLMDQAAESHQPVTIVGKRHDAVLQVSPSTVMRHRQAHGLKPHRVRGVKVFRARHGLPETRCLGPFAWLAFWPQKAEKLLKSPPAHPINHSTSLPKVRDQADMGLV